MAGSGTGIERIESGGVTCLRAGAGNGPHLVLVHGIGSNAESFVPLIERLSGAFDVLAWNAPGYVDSTPLEKEWPSASDYAQSLAALMDRLGIPRAAILGHSLGALVAGRFTVLHPQRVATLILSSPALGNGAVPGQPLPATAAARLDGLITEGAAQFAASRAPNLVFRKDNGALVAAVTEAMSKIKLPGYAHAVRMLACGDLIADAAAIGVSTLVLVGDRDAVTQPADCRRVYDALCAATPNLDHRFALVPDAGHAVAQEAPDEVAKLVAGWLTSHAGTLKNAE
ncbi:MAG: alpha/beta fold hydrolase [Hyphomicrobiaceae bacterium]